jgi:hypothetical protein
MSHLLNVLCLESSLAKSQGAVGLVAALHPFIPPFVEVGMNRIIKVGQQVVLVAFVAAVAAFVSVHVAMQTLNSSQAKAKTYKMQLVEDPRPCQQGC